MLSAMRSAVGATRAMVALVLLVVAGALVADSHKNTQHLPARVIRALSKADPQSGCLYEGRWYAAGASVRAREACLACSCAHGALSCRRRTCAPLPAPPPRCHVLHRRGECCPELRCADGVQQQHRARLDDPDVDSPPSGGHVCAEGGAVYAAGSAMSAGAACEQCFCLGGARRCVRPRCLPPPPGCRARAAPGACCPQRYYCEHALAQPSNEKNPHDCVTPEGTWAMEGERVKSAEIGLKCIQCFCLRGSIRCQHMACAPTLQGCTPLVRPGQCCAHQYQCQRHHNGTIAKTQLQRQNILMSLKDEDRSLHISKSTKRETALKGFTVTDKSTVAVTQTDPVTTNKKKTVVPDIISSSVRTEKSEISTLTYAPTTQIGNDVTSTATTEITTMEESSEEFLTEQPEGSVKVLINGTINCTSELSSTSLLLNISDTNNTAWINSLTQPRIPIMNTVELDSHTFSPNDIITQGNYKEFDENETFTINVTSSLRSNTSHSTTPTTKPLAALPKTVSPALLGNKNISKVKKDEYDYDYTEPTLPPSLPNLKIIPFVAADAVVEDDISSKESLDYTVLDTEDKYPVYYPNKEPKETIYADHKEDIYNPTQYPIFISKKVDPQYPSLTQETDSVNIPYPSITNEMSAPVQEYTITASLGNSAKVNYEGEKLLSSSTHTKFEVKPPAVNLFSPPIETEGGFIPKEPGMIEDYYSIYPSTPSGNIIPHLTTSMQLEPKDECISSDGRHVLEGESINFACSICSCAWGELHCAPRPCNTPPGCKRKLGTDSTELCCGELICENINNHTSTQLTETVKLASLINANKLLNKIEKAPVFVQDITTVSSTIITNYGEVNKNLSSENITTQNNKTLKDMIPISLVTTEKSSFYAAPTKIADNVHQKNTNHSLEYEDEDDSDGFSLGSVLKLLLSETYETTTAAPKMKLSTGTASTSPKTTTIPPTFITKIKQLPTSESGFMPVTLHSPYMPPKKLYPHDTIHRIDHLVLGESSAIRKATPKPIVFKPMPTSTMQKVVTSTTTTQQPITSKTVEIASKEGFVGAVDVRPPATNFLSALGLGLPKLAGCNIYGRMYRVGRIITELSSPCQECKCTELGVQCRSLSC